MTVQDSRRTRRRVYRIGLMVSAAWLVTTLVWTRAVVSAILESRGAATWIDRLAVFDRYEPEIVGGAVVGCLLFVTRVAMFLQWPDARLLWRSWRR